MKTEWCSLCLVCSPALLCHCLRKRRESLHDWCDLLRSFFLFWCVSYTVARASPHLWILSRLRLKPPVSAFLAEKEFDKPCDAPSAECFVELLKFVCRLLEVFNTGPGDCTASLESGSNMFWTLLRIPPGIVRTCLHICALYTVFWRCISAGTSTFMSMYCCCETSVLCCTFWPVLLMCCTCGNFNGLCILWTWSARYTAPGEPRSSAHWIWVILICSITWFTSMTRLFRCTIFMMIWNNSTMVHFWSMTNPILRFLSADWLLPARGWCWAVHLHCVDGVFWGFWTGHRLSSTNCAISFWTFVFHELCVDQLLALDQSGLACLLMGVKLRAFKFETWTWITFFNHFLPRGEQWFQKVTSPHPLKLETWKFLLESLFFDHFFKSLLGENTKMIDITFAQKKKHKQNTLNNNTPTNHIHTQQDNLKLGRLPSLSLLPHLETWNLKLEKLFRSFFQTFFNRFFNHFFQALFEALFWSTFLKHFFEALFWSTFLKHFFEALFWSTFLKHFFEALFWSTFLKHFFEALLKHLKHFFETHFWNTFLKHIFETIFQTLFWNTFCSTFCSTFLKHFFETLFLKHFFFETPFSITFLKHFFEKLFPWLFSITFPNDFFDHCFRSFFWITFLKHIFRSLFWKWLKSLCRHGTQRKKKNWLKSLFGFAQRTKNDWNHFCDWTHRERKNDSNHCFGLEQRTKQWLKSLWCILRKITQMIWSFKFQVSNFKDWTRNHVLETLFAERQKMIEKMIQISSFNLERPAVRSALCLLVFPFTVACDCAQTVRQLLVQRIDKLFCSLLDPFLSACLFRCARLARTWSCCGPPTASPFWHRCTKMASKQSANPLWLLECGIVDSCVHFQTNSAWFHPSLHRE